jgi:hypothetical protein
VVKLTKADIAKLTPIDLSIEEKSSWSSFLGIAVELSKLISDDAVVIEYNNFKAIAYSPSSNTVQLWELECDYGECDGSDDYDESWVWQLESTYTPAANDPKL